MFRRLRGTQTRTLFREYIRNFRWRSLWADVREAIAGSDKDFTSVNLGRAIFLLALPMVLELTMESVFALVDIFFVSRLGADAVATVGITESLMTIVYSLALGLATATTALVSRRIGEKDHESASTVAVQAILAGVAVSMVISVPGVLYAKDILRLMGASGDILSAYSGYTTVMLGANMVIFLLFIINAVFRSSGDAAVSMRVLWLANGINIFLDPCLIFGWGPFPELGITGAAVATNIGRGTAILYQFYILFRGKERVRLERRHWKINIRVIKTLLRLSLGGIGQSLIATTSWIGLVRIVSIFGSAVVAGYTIAIRIVMFSLLPAWGLSNAAATLVGQNLGAGKPARAEQSAWRTGFINMGFMGIVAVLIILFPGVFMRFFIQDPDVIRSGGACLRLLGYGYISYGLGMAIVSSFNGAGDTATPTYINFFCFWLLEIPLAYVLALPLGFRENGVYVSILAAETMMTLAAVVLFRRGKWKNRKV